MSTLTHNTIAPDVETSGAGYQGRFAGAVGHYFLETQAAGVRRLLGCGESGREGRRPAGFGFLTESHE